MVPKFHPARLSAAPLSAARPTPSGSRPQGRARALLALTLALTAAVATARPAAALALIDPGDAGWQASFAAGKSTGFETAEASGGKIDAGFASLSAMSPGAVMPGYDPTLPGGTGGAIGLENLGAGAWGASGMAVSTLDLAWPYGLVIDFDVPMVAIDAVWGAANADWQVLAYDADGKLIGETVIAGFDENRSPVSGGTGAEAGHLAVALTDEEAEAAVGGGISRLELRSLGGYDWLYIDDLRAAVAAPGAGGGTTPGGAPALSTSEVPLPASMLLLGGALLALGRAARRRVA